MKMQFTSGGSEASSSASAPEEVDSGRCVCPASPVLLNSASSSATAGWRCTSSYVPWAVTRPCKVRLQVVFSALWTADLFDDDTASVLSTAGGQPHECWL